MLKAVVAAAALVTAAPGQATTTGVIKAFQTQADSIAEGQVQQVHRRHYRHRHLRTGRIVTFGLGAPRLYYGPSYRYYDDDDYRPRKRYHRNKRHWDDDRKPRYGDD